MCVCVCVYVGVLAGARGYDERGSSRMRKEETKHPHLLKGPCVEAHGLSNLSVLMVLIRLIISVGRRGLG